MANPRLRDMVAQEPVVGRAVESLRRHPQIIFDELEESEQMRAVREYLQYQIRVIDADDGFAFTGALRGVDNELAEVDVVIGSMSRDLITTCSPSSGDEHEPSGIFGERMNEAARRVVFFRDKYEEILNML